MIMARGGRGHIFAGLVFGLPRNSKGIDGCLASIESENTVAPDIRNLITEPIGKIRLYGGSRQSRGCRFKDWYFRMGR